MGQNTAMEFLRLFSPQHFTEGSPYFVSEDVLETILDLAYESRPPCLSENRQNFAQAMFAAYLIGVRFDQKEGNRTVNSGVVLSEKEGDISVTYASMDAAETKAPSSNPYDQWFQLWQLCKRGAITSRFGVRSCRGASSTRIVDSTELQRKSLLSMEQVLP